jgi:hypothetical protein
MKSVPEAIEEGRKLRSEHRAKQAILTYQFWKEHRPNNPKHKYQWLIGVKCQWPGRLGDGVSVIWPIGEGFKWPELTPKHAEWFAELGKLRLEMIKPEPWSTWPQLLKERRLRLWELLEECGLVEPAKCEHSARSINSATHIKGSGMIRVLAWCHDCKEEIQTTATPGEWLPGHI